MSAEPPRHDLLARVTAAFVDSRLVPLMVLASLFLGVFAVVKTPSEEEPQITAPMIDVHVSMPGATPREIERRVAAPMEKILMEIPGVEYVYSTAGHGEALCVVRFEVGQDPERSAVKTHDRLFQHLDWIPPGCSQPLLKPRSIDDVPLAALTFHGGGLDVRQLRALALQVNEEVRRIPGVAETTVLGGMRRAVSVELDPVRLRSHGLDAADVLSRLTDQNQADVMPEAVLEGRAAAVRLDSFFRSSKELARAVLAVREGRPVYLGDVARVQDAFDEPGQYVFHFDGPASGRAEQGVMAPAVTLAVSKRAGANATDVTRAVARTVEQLRGYVIPQGVAADITRDYGGTARAKVHELLEHLALAALSVGAIVWFFLGRRASLVVMVAVPVTLALTLATYWFMGYTLNRVTLFALIFCIGILVDDPIVDVENIVRHLEMPGNARRPLARVIVEAVGEVRAPLVLATFTVVAAIMPMAFVGGLMGPYMRPMPIGASVAMLLSMGVAFFVTPYTAKHLLKPEPAAHAHAEGRATLLYRRAMESLIRSPKRRLAFLGVVAALLLAACALVPARAVLVKMLPFDNKSEFQVVLDMPLGTPLEETARVAAEMARAVLERPDVASVQLYAGVSGPFSFNGLVRHYYLRQGQNQADLAVNLAPKSARPRQSHDIAKAVRLALMPIALRHGARLKVAEVPPGPPVLQTLVAEVYGPDPEGRLAVARQVRQAFQDSPGVTDVDWLVDDPRPEPVIRIERDKALAAGVDPRRALEVVAASLRGGKAGLLHDESAGEDAPVVVRLPLRERAHLPDIQALAVRGQDGTMVSLDQIASVTLQEAPSALYRKNLRPVVFVTGDVAGSAESPVYAMGAVEERLAALEKAGTAAWQALGTPSLTPRWLDRPPAPGAYGMVWDGEWRITQEVFRDMGIAFAVVMALIYILVVGWFGSYTTPIAIMSPIPLSLVGILPAHALAGAFFTATSMIGFIAGAGIVVRNSIILVDFIEMRRAQGAPLEEAVVEAGAVRFRPMLLTAAAVVAGAFVILFDPIFQGLAISLMAGELAATFLSRMVVPVTYYLDQRRAGSRAALTPTARDG
ncbi:Efflux pump membrane transporter BepG [Fundidesulfovibrio magnetotacticus]|uniref:Efflux pump membrane transporter BepG n=1 Tax=Fundidesulfovibrio magnetotacticus TaxID=2730080 RepID=A0A6V8LRU4_9BACT|nr:efflux RND transporter permease subunit [Fundidesulfovibrio magnetotacticus]GFK92839.1 Efflux pump membrane transporter BepG [Fundidesulfovibrio magnetotacticus]